MVVSLRPSARPLNPINPSQLAIYGELTFCSRHRRHAVLARFDIGYLPVGGSQNECGKKVIKLLLPTDVRELKLLDSLGGKWGLTCAEGRQNVPCLYQSKWPAYRGFERDTW